MEERSKATFDLTFHAPKNMALVSVGDLKDSATAGNTRTTHWVTPGPIRNAAFNFGIFETTHGGCARHSAGHGPLE